jgi:putative ABC transport system permease protein
MDIIDIKWTDLIFAYILLLIPFVLFWYFRTGLVGQTAWAIFRMTVQLILIGLYLEFLFNLNNMWVNLLWIFLMILVANYTIIKRSDLSLKYFFAPIFLSVFVSLLLVDIFFLGITLRMENVFETRYMIPITGMILGNCLRSNIIALNSFYHRLGQEQNKYRYYLSLGATRNEALAPFMREALRKAFNPLIGAISVIGIISIPGMMTGQLLSGTDPNLAIKYQIMIMIAILVASLVTVVLSIFTANYFAFDGYDRFNPKFIEKDSGSF